MQELHPHFQFHTGDWLTRHLVLMHCQVMSKTFAQLGDNPDVKIYEKYMKKQRQNREKESQKALKKRRIEPPRHLVLQRGVQSMFALSGFEHVLIFSFVQNANIRF